MQRRVGRRLWRRKKLRTRDTPASPPGTRGPHAANDSDDDDARDDDNPRNDDDNTAVAVTPPASAGLFARLRSLWSRTPAPPKPPPPPTWSSVDDPVRLVLTLPRGAARLDAFEQTLTTLRPQTPDHRAVALAFSRELLSLADGAGIDLSLLESRVEAAARALMAAGEDERAGTLFARIGRRHQAAERFIAAGALDALEEEHKRIESSESGPRFDARLSYERFEALYLVGLRIEAIEALTRATTLWPENVVYAEILRTVLARVLEPHRVLFRAGEATVLVDARWPLVIGRGEDAAVRVASPLVSRAHLRLELVNDAPVVVDLLSKGGTRVDGQELVERRALANRGNLDMGGVVVEYAHEGDTLVLWPALNPETRTVAPFDTARARDASHVDVSVPAPSGPGRLLVRLDTAGHALVVDVANVRLNGESLQRPTLLLEGDRVEAPGFVCTVARS